MRLVLVTACFSVFLAHCGRVSQESDTKYDSFHSIALDGVIDQGIIDTTSTSDADIKEQIIEQLHYSVGLLNTWGSVGNVSQTLTKVIKIANKQKISEKVWRVTYAASMSVSWARAYQIPDEIELILPYSADSGLQMPEKFYNMYAVTECLDPSQHELGLGNIWYYLRPHNRGCSLGLNGQVAELSVRFPIRLKVSDINTTGHSPEYHKFWEDGRLVVTSVFSKSQPGHRNPRDEGVMQYNRFFAQLQGTYGRPTRLSHRVSRGGPGEEVPELTAEYQSARGPIEVRMFLVDGMSHNGEDFDAKFGAATLDSDIVMYNGHADLGGNVVSLAHRIQVRPGQYQLFMLNGCDTYAYISEEIMQKHKAVNPNAPDFKFVDIIANSMPSYFHYNSYSAMLVINAAVSGRFTYREILSSFDESQHAVVIGEEDNN